MSASYTQMSQGAVSGGSFTSSSASTAGTHTVSPFNDGVDTFAIGDAVIVELDGEVAEFYLVIGTTDDNGVVLEAGNGLQIYLSNDSIDNGSSVTVDESSNYVFCFLENTLITVRDSNLVPVQKLKIGDEVLTGNGTYEKILWIGRQTVNNTMFTDYRHAPVCISAGALGDNLPLVDLYVTPNHGMIIDGLVINAAALVNDSTIRFVPLSEMTSEFTYYHIETANHDEIYANGSLAETFVDYVTRSGFDNYQEYLDLFGTDKRVEEISKPRVSAQRQLPSYLVERFGITPHYKNIDSELRDLLPVVCDTSDANIWKTMLSQH